MNEQLYIIKSQQWYSNVIVTENAHNFQHRWQFIISEQPKILFLTEVSVSLKHYSVS